MKCRILKHGEAYIAQANIYNYIENREKWESLLDATSQVLLFGTPKEAEATLRDYANRHRQDGIVTSFEVE